MLQANTFQAVIATDGQRTYAFFIYGDIEWGDGATVGFNAGDGVRFIVVTTQPLDVETGSNVGITGLYINRVDLFDPTDGEKIPVPYTSNLFVLFDYFNVLFFLPSYNWIRSNDLFCA